MAIKKKTKNKLKSKVSIEEIQRSYKFEYLKFNFSFLTSNNSYSLENKKIDAKIKADILDRILELSQDTYLSLSAMTKNRGYETIDKNSISISAKCKEQFYSNDGFRDTSDKYTIFRLYPNNNPLPVRIIGKVNENIFYVHYIEVEHKCYK